MLLHRFNYFPSSLSLSPWDERWACVPDCDWDGVLAASSWVRRLTETVDHEARPEDRQAHMLRCSGVSRHLVRPPRAAVSPAVKGDCTSTGRRCGQASSPSNRRHCRRGRLDGEESAATDSARSSSSSSRSMNLAAFDLFLKKNIYSPYDRQHRIMVT